MNHQHTPGPWHLHDRRPFDGVDAIMRPYAIMAENTDFIARVIQEYPSVNAQANANVIIAAPDMLSALEALFEHCVMIHKHWGDGANTKEAAAAQKQALDAIAKALGKEQS